VTEALALLPGFWAPMPGRCGRFALVEKETARVPLLSGRAVLLGGSPPSTMNCRNSYFRRINDSMTLRQPCRDIYLQVRVIQGHRDGLAFGIVFLI